MRILCTADLHIGRRSSKVPEDFEGVKFSAGNAWSSIVDYAINNNITALLLAGDVVDHDNRYYEAIGPLEVGLKRLAENNIHTIAIAGNHDYDVLFRLETYVGTNFYHLIGKGGKWERYTIQENGDNLLHIFGWSFPTEHVNVNPLLSLPSIEAIDTPTLGLLHADVDQIQSNYAPVQRRELIQIPVPLWVIGHTHFPSLTNEEGEPHILIPGSPQALDPGETGKHGVWSFELNNQIISNIEYIPISNIRYENLDVDMSKIHTRDDWDWKCAEELRNFGKKNNTHFGPLELLMFRLRLHGRTPLYGQLDDINQKIKEDLTLEYEGVSLRIDKIFNQTSPILNLEELSKSNDPPGILSRMIIDLESTNPSEFSNLIHDAHERIQHVFRHKTFSDVADSNELPTISKARELLIDEGYHLLDQLLIQQENE